MGRDTLYKPEYDKIAEEKVSKGHSATAVAAELNVCRDTIYEWKKQHASFSDAIKRGVAKGQDFFEKRMLALGSGLSAVTDPKQREMLESIDKTALIFIMKTRFWRDWGVKQQVEHSGQVQTGTDLSKLSDDELDTMKKLLKKTNETPES
jgi:transposase-like protein